VIGASVCALGVMFLLEHATPAEIGGAIVVIVAGLVTACWKCEKVLHVTEETLVPAAIILLFATWLLLARAGHP